MRHGGHDPGGYVVHVREGAGLLAGPEDREWPRAGEHLAELVAEMRVALHLRMLREHRTLTAIVVILAVLLAGVAMNVPE